MAWYDEAIFYHIYPLGLANAPKQNSYEKPVHRLNQLIPWISHIKQIGCNAVYIGPLFESVGHGYETTDYKKLDSRLGTNEDLANFVSECHKQGVRVIFDGVFNHTGRDFFSFQDIKRKRENYPYKDWYCNVNFWGNNEYDDGFSYENWGGYNLLVKLNQHNPAVKDYICDVVRFWVKEFDVDGIRLDAADVLDFDFMKALRQVANEVKPEFWLMGEVIHGDYTRWVNEGTLHSVTNYHLHKALYSGHNDHNYFEIAHTVKRLYAMGGNRPDGLKLYNFVDNHDVERIYTKLSNKMHFMPVHVLLYTLPGIPSLYYGSEFGIEGKKERFSDDSLRPALSLSDYEGATETNPYTSFIAALGKARQKVPALSYGDYQELLLRNRQYAFSRNYQGQAVVVTVNNDDSSYVMSLPAGNAAEYVGALSGQKVAVEGGNIVVDVAANSGEIWIPVLGAQEVSEGPVPERADMPGSRPDPAVTPLARAGSEKGPKAHPGPKKAPKGQKEASKVAPETAKAPHAGPKPAGSSDKPGARPGPGQAPAAQPSRKPNAQPDPDRGSLDYEEIFEKGRVAGLQDAILAIMEKNGPVTDQMRKDVRENVYPDSLVTWVKSFR